MDLEGQGRIQQVVKQSGTDGVIAMLGANSAAAVEMTAVTIKSGDPSYAGPLFLLRIDQPLIDRCERRLGELAFRDVDG